MAASTRLEFDRPPIQEVVCGIEFVPLGPEFRVPHYGKFWTKVQADYPKCDQAVPVGDINVSIDPTSGLPFPRIWLISADEQTLIQIQRDRFLFNWRLRNPKEAYIRFANVFDRFHSAYKEFCSFLTESGIPALQPTTYELTYINILVKGREWETPEGLQNVLPFTRSLFQIPGVKAHTINVGVVSDLPEGVGRLVCTVGPAERAIDKVPVIKFDLQARGIDPDGKMSVVEWFGRAHDSINGAFIAMTSEETQKKLWGRKDNVRR